jgi:hypothetical protein
MEASYSQKLPHLVADLHRSEPDLLVEIADRQENWSLVLALVGEGQEIHSGEEAGMVQWAEALRRSSRRWEVHGPERFFGLFSGFDFRAEPTLNLDTSLRAQAASDLHLWVSQLLDHGALDFAGGVARRLRRDGFPIYVTRDLDGARAYARGRFEGEAQRRFGLVASSKARNLAPYGLATDFQATKKLQIGPWFNAGPESPRSCCRLDSVVTEFQCQGLELDLPIVCWADDFTWAGTRWTTSAGKRRQPLVRDPHRLRLNAYRVLLTRGREGIVVFIPPTAAMQPTFEALVRSGALPAEHGPLAAVA